jgi:hypothetical protein
MLIPHAVPVIHRLWSYIRVKMWTSITTGVNNFFSGESMGDGLRRSKRLKRGFLSLFTKLVETLKTMVYNYLNSFIWSKTMGRPSKPNTRYFQRTLTDPERIILLSAGKGNLCRGFETVLDLYHYAHNQGFRPDMEMSILNIVADKQQPQTEDQR